MVNPIGLRYACQEPARSSCADSRMCSARNVVRAAYRGVARHGSPPIAAQLHAVARLDDLRCGCRKRDRRGRIGRLRLALRAHGRDPWHARHLPLGRRWPRQDVPDGPVSRSRRAFRRTARALPSLHEGCARAPRASSDSRGIRSISWPPMLRATIACCVSTSSSSATSPTR